MNSEITPIIFRERFALALFDDGGIVVDLFNGNYWRLNSTAAACCSAFQNESTLEDAIAAASASLGVPTSVATEYIQAITANLNGPSLRRERSGPFQYLDHEGGYELWHSTQRVLQVDGRGDRVTLVARPSDLTFQIFDYLKGIAPKLLFLRGHTVLHGSAVTIGSGATAICGASGAGKTTTAKALARHGAPLIAEDLLVVGDHGIGSRIFTDGERRILGWCREGTKRLLTAGATVDAQELDSAAAGTTIELQSVWFLDARRRGNAFKHVGLSRTETLEQLLAHAFLGAGGTAAWRRHLLRAHTISVAVRGSEISAPDGLDQLDQAIGAYMVNST